MTQRFPSEGVPVNKDNVFAALTAFGVMCRKDQTITPTMQLVYRLLIEEANAHFWQESFAASTLTIAATAHVSVKSFYSARKKLQERGLIRYLKTTRITFYTILVPSVKSIREGIRSNRKFDRKSCEVSTETSVESSVESSDLYNNTSKTNKTKENKKEELSLEEIERLLS